MKITKEDLKKGKIKLIISVAPEELLRYFRSVYDKLAREVKIAGFRPGKAPRKLIEESLGTARLLSEAIDKTVREEYFLAVQEQKIITIGPPKIVISKYPNWGLEEAEIGSDLLFEVEVEVMPKVELKDFSKVKIEKKDLAKVSEQDVKKILTHLRRQKATFSDLKRGAKIGDRVEISYEGFLNKVKQDAMSARNHPLILGEGNLIPGFEEQIVGMKKGDKKKISIVFPKDYHSSEHAGKKADFEIELNELKQIDLPRADDEFAKNFGHKTVGDLALAIKKSLKEEIDTKARQELETSVLEKVLPYLLVQVPEGLIDQEVERLVADMAKQIESRGLTLVKYLESIKKTEADLRKDLRPVAEKNIKIGFLLGKIIEENKLDPKNPEAGKEALEILIKKVSK